MKKTIIWLLFFLITAILSGKAMAEEVVIFQQPEACFMDSADSIFKREFNYPGQVLKYIQSQAEKTSTYVHEETADSGKAEYVVLEEESVDDRKLMSINQAWEDAGFSNENNPEEPKIIVSEMQSDKIENEGDEIRNSSQQEIDNEEYLSELNSPDTVDSEEVVEAVTLKTSTSENDVAVSKKKIYSGPKKESIVATVKAEDDSSKNIDLEPLPKSITTLVEPGENLSSSQTSKYRYSTLSFAAVCSLVLSFFVFKYKSVVIFPKKIALISSNREYDRYVGRCLMTDNFAIFSKGLEAVFQDKDMKNIAKFAKACDCETPREICFKIPESLRDQYLPITEEELRIFQGCFDDFKSEKRY